MELLPKTWGRPGCAGRSAKMRGTQYPGARRLMAIDLSLDRLEREASNLRMMPLAQLEKPLTKAQKARVVAAVKRAKTRTEIEKQVRITLPSIYHANERVAIEAADRPLTAELGPHAALVAINPTLGKIHNGISLKEFETLAKKLGFSHEDFGRKLGMSSATLSRRKRTNAALDPNYSDRLVRYQRLFEQALRLFDGSEENARDWLKNPQRALAYQRPIDIAETETGAREVENILGRLEYGELT